MNANERLMVKLYAIAHAAEHATGQLLFDALDAWKVERLREVKRVVNWIDELGRTPPTFPIPESPSEERDGGATPAGT